MRFLILTVMIVFGGMTAKADVDQWKITCQEKKGQFSILKEGDKELSMCFFGETGVGAEALSQLKDEGVTVESVKAYKNGKSASPRGGVCGAFDAELITAKDPQGNAYNICRFADKSVMEETTLWLGPGGAVNGEDLDEALSL